VKLTQSGENRLEVIGTTADRLYLRRRSACRGTRCTRAEKWEHVLSEASEDRMDAASAPDGDPTLTHTEQGRDDNDSIPPLADGTGTVRRVAEVSDPTRISSAHRENGTLSEDQVKVVSVDLSAGDHTRVGDTRPCSGRKPPSTYL
jgi:hypothetical protein